MMTVTSLHSASFIHTQQPEVTTAGNQSSHILLCLNIPCLHRGLREAVGLYQSHLSFRPSPLSQIHERKGQC